MSRTKRITALALAILAVFMFCGSPFQQSAKAVVIVDDALIAIIVAALAAFGITFTYTGGYFTVYDWLAQMVDESGADFTGCNIGVNSLSNLLLNNKFVRELQIVAFYITSTYGMVSNTDVNIFTSQTGVRDELTGIVYQPGWYNSKTEWENGTTLFTYYINGHNGEVDVHTFRFDGVYYKFTIDHLASNQVNFKLESSVDLETWTRETSSMQYNSNSKHTVSLFEDDGIVWLYLNTYSTVGSGNKVVQLSNVSVGEDLTANIGTLNIPTDTEIGDNYGILSLPVPWGESYQIILDSIPNLSDADRLEGNTTLTLDSDTVVESQIDTDLTNQPYVSEEPSDYQSRGLQNVFPFCIPFDIYNFFGCLAADPVAPSFNWRFYVPRICDFTITLDLSQFDTVAQIVRTMELLAFIVGLALITRDKFLRG